MHFLCLDCFYVAPHFPGELSVFGYQSRGGLFGRITYECVIKERPYVMATSSNLSSSPFKAMKRISFKAPITTGVSRFCTSSVIVFLTRVSVIRMLPSSSVTRSARISMQKLFGSCLRSDPVYG